MPEQPSSASEDSDATAPSPGEARSAWSSDPRERRIQEAQEVLRALNFDAERCNERSALVLLALLDLSPEKPWSRAGNPPLRTVKIIHRVREEYGKAYQPNTRETIRRRTLHQFAEAALVEVNPDEPARPTNSPSTCYRVEVKALDLLRHYGGDDFDDRLRDDLTEVPGLRELYARARQLTRIPVVLPDGSAVTLSPGGQNVLLKQMLEDFCGYFTPGGRVLYVGDADDKWSIFQRDELAALGVEVSPHGKMPDLIVYLPEKDWLVLLEAAPSHGPVDAKRHGELRELFKASTAQW